MVVVVWYGAAAAPAAAAAAGNYGEDKQCYFRHHPSLNCKISPYWAMAVPSSLFSGLQLGGKERKDG